MTRTRSLKLVAAVALAALAAVAVGRTLEDVLVPAGLGHALPVLAKHGVDNESFPLLQEHHFEKMGFSLGAQVRLAQKATQLKTTSGSHCLPTKGDYILYGKDPATMGSWIDLNGDGLSDYVISNWNGDIYTLVLYNTGTELCCPSEYCSKVDTSCNPEC